MTDANAVSLSAQGDIAIGGDVVGRDKIITNIQNIVQRALTAAEEAQTERGIERQELAKGVSAFARNLQARAGVDTVTRGNPYKGLLTYRLSDAALFFGRARAVADVLDRLGRGPLLILHSESGAGKSSLLQAGVMPQLIGRGHLPVFLRPYKVEPYLSIKRAFLPDLGVAPLLATGPLRDFLRQVTDILGPECRLYIFLDQAEELFTQLSDAARGEFVHELADCLEDQSLNVRWTLAMRTEFFGELANFRPTLRDPFANDYRLNRLSLDEARDVVTEPAKRRGVVYEAGLVDALLKDLGQAEISPPEIQIVCSALYEELPPAETVAVRTITRELYDGQGGALGLLRDHLDRVLSRDLPADRRAVARRLLEALISSDGRRIIRPRSTLLKEAAALNLTPEAFDTLVGQLIDGRLMRSLEPTPDNPEVGYELAHDYLVARITVDPAVQARKATQELLEQEVQAFKRHGTLLSDQKLSIIEARQAELTLNDDARDLIRRSEKALRRQRRLIQGGLGLVVLLILAAVAAGVLTLQAQNAQAIAVETQRAAEFAAATSLAQADLAGTEAAVAAQEVRTASTQVSQAAAEVRQASTQRAQSEQFAQVAQATATAALGRAEDARQVVRALFDDNGLAPVSDNPTALVYERQQDLLWVALENNDQLKALDPATGDVVREAATGARPWALAYDGELLWVANRADGIVQAIDPVQAAPVITLSVAGEPVILLYVEGRDELWVGSLGTNSVQAIDLVDQTVGRAVVFDGQPLALAYAANRVWVTTRDAPRNRNRLVSLQPDTLAVMANVDVGARPSALAYDGVRLWIANQDSDSLQVVTPGLSEDVAVSRSLRVGSRPGALLWDGTWLWIATQGDNSVRVLDPLVCERRNSPSQPFSPEACSLSAPIPVGNLPQALAVTGDQVWVANYSDFTVQALDLVAAFSIPVGNGPRRLAYSEFGGRPQLWVANQSSNTVQAIDLDVNGDPLTGQANAPWRTGAEPRSLAAVGADLWVTNSRDNQVLSLSLTDGSWRKRAGTDRGPRALLYDDVHGQLWFANNTAGTVQSVDPATGIAGITITVDAGPFDLAFDGRRVWVSSSVSYTVQAIDPVTRAPGVHVDVCANPGAMAFDGAWLWVACFDDNTLLLIDPETGELGPSLLVGAGPSGLAYDADTRRMWVANFKDNTVQWVRLDEAAGTFEASRPIRVDSGPIYALFVKGRLWVANFNVGRVQYVVVRDDGP